VFVGYGVAAPEYLWNDYKSDVRGKVVVMLVNDPPSADAALFGGKAMTYYGRWTYKYEQAAAMGAAGAILVHNTDDAGYPWAVVENSWSGEQFDVVRADKGSTRCAFESWITEDAARDLFSFAGRSFDDEKKSAGTREFQPVALGLVASAAIKTRSRTLESFNVVGKVAGTGDLADEWIIYTAHWDHLGVGKPAASDSIYNGALDNASGGVLEVARAFVEGKRALKRSVLFLFTTGEESGLLGATHYTNYPLYPLENTVAEINIDGLNIWGHGRRSWSAGVSRTWNKSWSRRSRPIGASRPIANPRRGTTTAPTTFRSRRRASRRSTPTAASSAATGRRVGGSSAARNTWPSATTSRRTSTKRRGTSPAPRKTWMRCFASGNRLRPASARRSGAKRANFAAFATDSCARVRRAR
jgi:hypothetical protein